MRYLEFVVTISLIVIVTVVYFLLRKFIVWTIEDDNKFYIKNGRMGASKKELKVRKEQALLKLSGGYALILALLIVYFIKIAIDTM